MDITVDEDGNEELVETAIVYPPRLAGRPALAETSLLPKSVQAVYRETHQALCNEQQILAGVGIRALVETICNESSASSGTLQQKIDDLVKLGILTKDGATILHTLRVMGNAAAHEVQPHSAEDLGVAFDVVEHVLRGIYVLPKKAPEMRASRRKDQ